MTFQEYVWKKELEQTVFSDSFCSGTLVRINIITITLISVLLSRKPDVDVKVDEYRAWMNVYEVIERNRRFI